MPDAFNEPKRTPLAKEKKMPYYNFAFSKGAPAAAKLRSRASVQSLLLLRFRHKSIQLAIAFSQEGAGCYPWRRNSRPEIHRFKHRPREKARNYLPRNRPRRGKQQRCSNPIRRKFSLAPTHSCLWRPAGSLSRSSCSHPPPTGRNMNTFAATAPPSHDWRKTAGSTDGLE